MTVDGIVLHRDSTDLVALAAQMPGSFPSALPNQGLVGNPDLEQFGHGPGGRITFTSQVGRCANYDIQAVYEGVNDWDASIVFPKQAITPLFYTPGVAATTTTTVTVVTPPTTTTTTTTTGPAFPAGTYSTSAWTPFPEGLQQRRLDYRSNLNSVELNWLPNHNSEWRPLFGARFIRLDDEISDSLNQEVQTPLPFEGANPDVGQFLGVAETDRLNLFHVENNLMGFQVGLLHDTLELSNRFAIEGVVNGGVYYNKIKYSHVNLIRTTQVLADDTATTGFDETRSDDSTALD